MAQVTVTRRQPHAGSAIIPLARLAITGLRVLMVPQFSAAKKFAGASEDQLYSSARTTMSAQEGSVIVLMSPRD